MKRRNPPITLSTLPARTIYHAVLQFTQHHPRPHTKGRKPLYPEALILTLALLRKAPPALRRFQSLIGRLKTSVSCLWRWALMLFQSLIGRLKTGIRSARRPMSDCGFQSLIGRLKTNPHTASAAGFELKSQL